MEDEKAVEHQHDFDGIVELDNDLPRWWLGIFWVTALLAVFYIPYYHFIRPELLPEASYSAAVAEVEKVRSDEGVEASQGPTLTERFAAGGWEEGAKADFATYCAACHATDGGGGIGPNFTDDYYIHGGSLEDLVAVITNGVPAKGMVPWRGTLKPDQIDHLAFYISKMRGTTAAAPKAAEGVLVDAQGNPVEEAPTQ